MAEDLFDYSLLLDLNKAHVVAQDTTGLNTDEVYELRFKCANAAYPAAKRWLVANRRILNNFEAEFKSYPDLYRTISITWKENKSDARDGGYIIHTIAKGLLTSLVSGGNVDWSEARKVSARDLEGNAESAPDSIANTTSDDQERHITISWPYCDPLEAQAILDSLSASTYTDVSADGEAIAGTWHRIITSYEKAEDGTCAVTMRLAEPQFTLNAYRSLETMDGSDVVYLWQVPKDLAQGIMDAWKVATPTEGRSASASYDSSGGLVNIVLTRVAGSPPNLSKTMNTACDEATSYHFAWRYTETEMGVFLDAHNGALGANMRRDVRVQTRSDGFFDVTITERVITFDADEHIFDVATVQGNHLIVRHWGWNVPLAELATRKVDFQIAAEGITSTFNVRRQDDCSFDYEGTIQTRSISTKTVDMGTGGAGVQVRVLSADAMTQADLTSQAASFQSAIRKHVQANVRVSDDGLASATFTETEVQKAEGTADSGTAGIIVEVMSGKNVDVGDLGGVYASAARAQVSISVTANDDGSFNYSATRQTVLKSEATADSGADGITIEAMSGKNVDVADLADIYESAARQQVSISLSSNDDGTFNYSATRQTVLASESTADSGTGGIAVETMSGKNVDASALAAIYDSAAREQVSISLSSNDDGTFNYSATRQTVQASESTADSGTEGVSVETMSGKNVDAAALADIYESAARKQVSISLSSNDDGTFNYSATRQTVLASEGTADSGVNGIAVETMSGKNVDAGALSAIYESAAREQVSISLSSNDDGTFNYSATRQTVQASEATADSGTEGITTEAIAGKNVDVGALAAIYASAARAQVSISLSANDDGTFNYSATRQTVQASEATADSGTSGIGIETMSGKNVDASALSAIYDSAAREQVSISLSSNDDGTFNYSATKQTVQASEGTADSGVNGIAVETMSGKNVDIGALSAIYESAARSQVSISLSSNDDGTFNYSATKQTVAKSEGSADSGGDGIAVETMSGKNVDLSDLTAIYDSAARQQVSISLSSNDDGTFNYSATKQTVQASEATANSGTLGVSVEAMSGKNVDAAALSAIYDSAARAQVSISLSSNDDGTFNYSATKQTVAKSEGSATSGNLGVSTEAMSGKNVDLSDLTSIYDSAARAQVSISLSSNDDGTFNYSATKQTVLKTLMASPWASTGVGINVEVTRGKNADLGDLPSVTTAVGETIQMDVTIHDDGTYDYLAIKRTTVPSTGSETIDNGGVATRVWYARNGTPANFAADMGSLGGERKNHSVSISPNDDGSLNYVITEKEVLEVVSPDVAVGPATTEGIDRRTQSGRNVSAAVLSGLATDFVAGIRKRHDIRVSENDDGTFNYAITETVLQKVEVSVTSTGAGVGLDVIAGGNVAEADLATVLDVAIREQASMSVSIKDDGSLDYTILKRSVNAFEDSLATTQTPGIKTTVYHGNNLLPSEIAQTIVTGPRKRINMNFRANDDGTTAYTAVVKELEDVTGLAILSGTGIGVRVKVAHNVDEDILNVFSGMTSGAGKRHSAKISPNDDGTIGYTVIQTTEQSPQNTSTIAAGASLGLGVSAFTGINATSAEIGSVISGLSSAARKTHQIKVSPQPDGGYSYAIVERTSQASEDSWVAGNVGVSQTIRVGKDQDSLSVTPPASGETITLAASFDNDGSVSYTEVRAQQNEVSPAGVDALLHGNCMLRKELTAGLFADTVKNIGAPTTGVSYEVQVEVLPTGKLNYKMVKSTANGVQSAAIPIGTTNPTLRSSGETRVAIAFRRATTPPTSLADYYEIKGLRLNEDCTWDGVLETIVYGDDTELTDLAGSFTTAVRHYHNATLGAHIVAYMRETHYSNSWIVTKDGPAALAHISGGLHSSSVGKIGINGAEYYIAKLILISSEAPWVKLTP